MESCVLRLAKTHAIMLTFSIVLPAYNAEGYVREAIESILQQSYPYFELLITDDCSTDNTRSIIDSYEDERIKVFHNEINRGYLVTCNKLFEKATGDFITFQDADDWSEPQRLNRYLDCFKKDEQLGVLGTHSKYVSASTGRLIRERKAPNGGQELNEYLIKGLPFDGATICVRQVLYKKIGGYNTFFDRIGAEDHDWLTRIAEHCKVGVIPECLYNVRVTTGSITRNITNPLQFHSHDIVRFCAQQRADGKIDSLSPGGERSILDNFINEKLKPYRKDPALLYRKNAEIRMYSGLYKSALKAAYQAVRTRPRNIKNLRTLLYVLRKANFKILR